MAKKITYTNATSEKHIKPTHIVVTLYTGSETTDVPAGDSFILEDVVEDTTSISQDDNDVNDIECETSDSPIISIVKLGKFQVAAEVADTQADLVSAMMGFTKGTTTPTKLFAPSQYKQLFVKFDVVFTDASGSKTAFVLPKVQLNSKLMLESLNSNVGRIAIAGTAVNAKIKDGTTDVISPFYIETSYTLPTASA